MVDEYIGQTYGPAGMGMSAYSNIPDPIFSEPLTVSELGQTYGPAGMGMSAYMDRPGSMEMAAPPPNIGYDRMGPDLESGIMPSFGDFFKQYKPKNPMNQGLEITVPVPATNLPVVNAGLPFNLFQDPTADGGIIDYFSRKLFGDDDPENDFDYEPLPDDFKGMAPPSDPFYDPNLPLLEANADTYSLPNLLQMLQDARDAGNVDEMELLTNDLEMMYPGATMDVATALPADLALDMLADPRYPDDVNIQNLIKIYGPDVFDNLPSFEGLDGNIYGNPNISRVLG